jgi:hypothetical protein
VDVRNSVSEVEYMNVGMRCVLNVDVPFPSLGLRLVGGRV